ncbi:MAG: hypothetical protein AAFV53_02745 [Myxococcota bacterium]
MNAHRRLFRDRRDRRDRRGYVMLVALVLLALLAVLGSTTLNIAGVDQRIAIQNRKHMQVVNTAMAGADHARDQLRWELPAISEMDEFIPVTDAEVFLQGLNYAQNQGVYEVDAEYLRCGSPPPGYSAEVSARAFRSDYWQMTSTARMQDAAFNNMNASQARSAVIIRKVMQGSCSTF